MRKGCVACCCRQKQHYSVHVQSCLFGTLTGSMTHSSAKSKCRCPSDGPVSLNHFSASKSKSICARLLLARKETGDADRCAAACCKARAATHAARSGAVIWLIIEVLLRFAVPAVGSAEYSWGDSACSRSLELHQARLVVANASLQPASAAVLRMLRSWLMCVQHSESCCAVTSVVHVEVASVACGS